MLAIPYLHHTGYPVSLRFRCLQSHDCRELNHGKYMSMTDEPSRMFNTGAILRADRELHITEGEFDAMILNQIGLPAVAIAGAQGWLPHYAVMMYGFSRVWVWGDPDEAGGEFVTKVTRSVRQAKGVNIKGGDINEVYLAQGAGELLAYVENREAA